MARIFKERAITADGVLDIKDFKLFSDAKTSELVPEKLSEVVKKAEYFLEQEIPLLRLSVFLEFRDNGNRSNYQNPYFKRREMALTLALAEAYEKKGRFTVKLLDTVWAILEESTWIIPAHMYNSPTHGEYGIPPVYDNTRMHGIDLFAASTAGVLTAVYSLMKDEFDAISPIVNERLKFMINDRIIKPYLNCGFWWTGEYGNGVNNWGPWITSNILHTMSVFVDDTYTRRRVVTKALNSLDAFTSTYREDGGCTEGPGYWGAAGASYFDCLELLYDITGGAINIYDHPIVKNMFEYIVKFNINGKRFINFADCPPFVHHDGIMIRRMGEKCGSETLCSFGDTMAMLTDGGVGYSGHSHVYRCLRNLTSPTPTATVSKAAKRVWFPNLKVMAARVSDDPSEGIFVAMKGGSNGEQHNHNDVGNVVVYYNGNPVLIDTGAGEYTKKTFSNERYDLWFMQSNYHNLPAFGGVAQKEGGNYVSTNEEYDEVTGGVKMELSKAYTPDAQLVSFVRETVLDDDGVIHITDSVEMKKEQEADFRYITCARPELEKEGVLKLAEGRTMTYDPRLTCEIEEFEVADVGIERNWKTKVLWRIHFRATFVKDSFKFEVK